MRVLRKTALTADPTLGNYSQIKTGERVQIYAAASAADDVRLRIMIGGAELADVNNVGIEAVAGRGPVVPDDLVADYMHVRPDDELNISVTRTAASVDILLVIV